LFPDFSPDRSKAREQAQVSPASQRHFPDDFVASWVMACRSGTKKKGQNLADRGAFAPAASRNGIKDHGNRHPSCGMPATPAA